MSCRSRQERWAAPVCSWWVFFSIGALVCKYKPLFFRIYTCLVSKGNDDGMLTVRQSFSDESEPFQWKVVTPWYLWATTEKTAVASEVHVPLATKGFHGWSRGLHFVAFAHKMEGEHQNFEPSLCLKWQKCVIFTLLLTYLNECQDFMLTQWHICRLYIHISVKHLLFGCLTVSTLAGSFLSPSEQLPILTQVFQVKELWSPGLPQARNFSVAMDSDLGFSRDHQPMGC